MQTRQKIQLQTADYSPFFKNSQVSKCLGLKDGIQTTLSKIIVFNTIVILNLDQYNAELDFVTHEERYKRG